MCNVLKKRFLKSLSISDEILSKFGVCGTPEYQRVTSKGSRTMGSEWPDNHDKTGFESVARGGGNISRLVILARLTVLALVWFDWATGLFSLCPVCKPHANPHAKICNKPLITLWAVSLFVATRKVRLRYPCLWYTYLHTCINGNIQLTPCCFVNHRHSTQFLST